VSTYVVEVSILVISFMSITLKLSSSLGEICRRWRIKRSISLRAGSERPYIGLKPRISSLPSTLLGTGLVRISHLDTRFWIPVCAGMTSANEKSPVGHTGL